jgi:hypothetical protein
LHEFGMWDLRIHLSLFLSLLALRMGPLGIQAARNEIEKLKLDELTARQAVVEVAKILHKVCRVVAYEALLSSCASL